MELDQIVRREVGPSLPDAVTFGVDEIHFFTASPGETEERIRAVLDILNGYGYQRVESWEDHTTRQMMFRASRQDPPLF